MQLRTLNKGDAEALRTFRLMALSAPLQSFGADCSEDVPLSIDDFQERIHLEPDRFTVGAFDHERLVAMGDFCGRLARWICWPRLKC